MMRPGESVEVYLCRDPVDLRKSIQGLSVLVEQTLGLDPFAQRLFVFCGRRRDKIKILYWERSGFVLWYKRLEAFSVARAGASLAGAHGHELKPCSMASTCSIAARELPTNRSCRT
jgi:hypothetical protein